MDRLSQLGSNADQVAPEGVAHACGQLGVAAIPELI
jgi:hypothetical protein